VVDVELIGDEVRIGRRAGLEIQLPFATVSGLHARIYRQGTEWGVLDMGSSNGTFIGPTRLPPGVPRTLKPGDVVNIADVSLTFEGEVGVAAAPATGPRPESTATLARRLVNDLFQQQGGAEVARLVVGSGPSAGQALALAMPDRTYRVGRSPDCDLVLPDDDVSREHAAFERRWQGVFVRDLGSKNGIQLDGQSIRGERKLRHGDVVVVGTTQLRVEDPEEKYLRDIDEKERAMRAPAPGAVSGGGGSTVPAEAAAPAREGLHNPAASPRPAPIPEARSTPASRPTVAGSVPDEADAPPVDEGDGRGRVRGSPILPITVSAFALAVLLGVGFLVWLLFSGMER
jgi:pSer/pThr/pTyr-binding forkhead associated (FHA) protein